MIRTRMLPATMAAIVAPGAAGVGLATTGPASAATDERRGNRRGHRGAVAAAIAVAERETGGRAVEIGVENGVALYALMTVSKDAITEVLVDPATGRVVRADAEGMFARMLDGEARDALAGLLAAPTTPTVPAGNPPARPTTRAG